MSLHPEFKTILDAISPNRTHYASMSDDQTAREYRCQERLANALYEVEQAFKMVNQESAVVRIRMSAWADFLHDEIPGTRDWSEKIEAARNP